MKNGNQLKRREPLTDTQLLLTITICIFVAMYALAMIFLGGGFLRFQQVFDMLNNNAALIIVACGLTIVMIGGGPISQLYCEKIGADAYTDTAVDAVKKAKELVGLK